MKSVGAGKNKGKKAVISLLILLLLGCLAALGWYIYTEWQQSQQTVEVVLYEELEGRTDLILEEVSEAEKTEWQVPANHPRYLTVDALGISNARIVQLGIKAGTNNQLDDPQNIWDAGWFNQSALPGNGTGQGLYDCHSGIGFPGLCKNLANLKNGDIIKIERGDGVIVQYRVAEVETPLVDQVDMKKLMTPFDATREGIGLITCSGNWDRNAKTYTNRTTIRAVII